MQCLLKGLCVDKLCITIKDQISKTLGLPSIKSFKARPELFFVTLFGEISFNEELPQLLKRLFLHRPNIYSENNSNALETAAQQG